MADAWLRMKYQLYNGVTPNDAIQAAVPSINQTTDLWLGQEAASGDNWMYGEIYTDTSSESTLETALTNWQASFFDTDQDAKDWVDGRSPVPSTVVQPKITVGDAAINIDRHVAKTYTES